LFPHTRRGLNIGLMFRWAVQIFICPTSRTTSDGRIGVRVYIGNKIADAALPQLEAERVAIEKEIGEPLQWNPNPDNKDKIILLDRAADLNNRDKWPEYVAWLAERVAQFKRAFEPRIKKLDLSQAQGAEPQA